MGYTPSIFIGKKLEDKRLVLTCARGTPLPSLPITDFEDFPFVPKLGEGWKEEGNTKVCKVGDSSSSGQRILK